MPQLSDNAEFATLKKVAFQRLAGHAQHIKNWIRPLADQVKFALEIVSHD
jgi:hypothetical protein